MGFLIGRRIMPKLLSSVSELAEALTYEPSAVAAMPRAAWPINESAYVLGISRVSVYEFAKTGELKLLRIAGRTLVPHSEIVRLTTVPAEAVLAAAGAA